MILVTRGDLSAGYQSVQPAHALAQFAIEYENTFKNWQINHKNLVVLAAEDEDHLMDIFISARSKGIKTSAMIEPDIDDQLTAIAMEPGEETYKLVSSLPLALKRRMPEKADMVT